MTTIVKHLASSSRISSVDLSNPVFGKECSDHMFTASYENGQWVNPEITFTDLEETYGGGSRGTVENTYVHIS